MPRAGRKDGLSAAEERGLVARAQAGDAAAAEQVLSANYNQMYRLALKYTGRPDCAEDAVQDSCVQVLTHLGQFRNESRFSSWMSRIVINCARRRHRKDHRLVVVGQLVELEGSHADPSPESVAAGREELVLVDDLLMDRNHSDHTIMYRRYVGGESIAEISDDMGISVPALKTRIHRARSWLKSQKLRQAAVS